MSFQIYHSMPWYAMVYHSILDKFKLKPTTAHDTCPMFLPYAKYRRRGGSGEAGILSRA